MMLTLNPQFSAALGRTNAAAFDRPDAPARARTAGSRTPSLALQAGVLFTPLAVALALCLSGCERPIQPEGVTAAPVYGEELDALWEASLSVLMKHDFQPQRQDRAMGLIVTRPTTSRQWGEFWRQDVDPSDRYGMLQASLHTMQRQATVRFMRGDEGWRLEVQVDVYRLSAPESQITTASSAIQAFSGALPTTEGEVSKDPRLRKQWVHVGRDVAIEERLLDRILTAAGASELAAPTTAQAG